MGVSANLQKTYHQNQVFAHPTILHHPSDIAENSEKNVRSFNCDPRTNFVLLPAAKPSPIL